MNATQREELLDQLFEIVSAEGFADIRVADLARRLRCSPNTLYKLAPTKGALFALILQRWADQTLSDASTRADALDSPKERARHYYRHVTDEIGALSSQFRHDVVNCAETSSVWVRSSDALVERFAGYLAAAMDAGEVRRMNPLLMAQILRRIAAFMRDEESIQALMLPRDEVYAQIDDFIWLGISAR